MLREAAKSGRSKTVSSLITQGIAIDQRDGFGNTTLHYACSNGHDETVSVLLPHADLDAANEDRLTALHLATRRGLDTIVMKLLECSQINVDAINTQAETALHHACYLNKPGCVAALVQAGADTNKKNKHGELALHLSSYHGHTDCTRLVLRSPDAQPNGKNAWGKTGLHLACSKGHADTVACLLEHGDPNVRDDDGKTPLHVATFRGHARVIE